MMAVLSQRLRPPTRERLQLRTGRTFLAGGADHTLWVARHGNPHQRKLATVLARYCAHANRPNDRPCKECGSTVRLIDAEQAANVELMRLLFFWWPVLVRDQWPYPRLHARLRRLHTAASPAPWGVMQIRRAAVVQLHAGVWPTDYTTCDAPTFSSIAEFAAADRRLAEGLATARNQLAQVLAADTARAATPTPEA
jgi:hypothetical protein